MLAPDATIQGYVNASAQPEIKIDGKTLKSNASLYWGFAETTKQSDGIAQCAAVLAEAIWGEAANAGHRLALAETFLSSLNQPRESTFDITVEKLLSRLGIDQTNDMSEQV